MYELNMAFDFRLPPAGQKSGKDSPCSLASMNGRRSHEVIYSWQSSSSVSVPFEHQTDVGAQGISLP